ncbi:MAG: FHA domain-containing protein [Pseudomonadota bacterium]
MPPVKPPGSDSAPDGEQPSESSKGKVADSSDSALPATDRDRSSPLGIGIGKGVGKGVGVGIGIGKGIGKEMAIGKGQGRKLEDAAKLAIAGAASGGEGKVRMGVGAGIGIGRGAEAGMGSGVGGRSGIAAEMAAKEAGEEGEEAGGEGEEGEEGEATIEAEVDAGIAAGIAAGVEPGVNAGVNAGVEAGGDGVIERKVGGGAGTGEDAAARAGIGSGIGSGMGAGASAGAGPRAGGAMGAAKGPRRGMKTRIGMAAEVAEVAEVVGKDVSQGWDESPLPEPGAAKTASPRADEMAATTPFGEKVIGGELAVQTQIDQAPPPGLLEKARTGVITDELPTIPARLLIISGTDRGAEHALSYGAAAIGRGTDNDFVLRDIAMSRRHAVLRWDGTRYLVKDLDSGNGTLVNGVTISGETPLRHGDELELGNTLVRFEDPLRASIAVLAEAASLQRTDLASTIRERFQSKPQSAAAGVPAVEDLPPSKAQPAAPQVSVQPSSSQPTSTPPTPQPDLPFSTVQGESLTGSSAGSVEAPSPDLPFAEQIAVAVASIASEPRKTGSASLADDELVAGAAAVAPTVPVPVSSTTDLLRMSDSESPFAVPPTGRIPELRPRYWKKLAIGTAVGVAGLSLAIGLLSREHSSTGGASNVSGPSLAGKEIDATPPSAGVAVGGTLADAARALGQAFVLDAGGALAAGNAADAASVVNTVNTVNTADAADAAMVAAAKIANGTGGGEGGEGGVPSAGTAPGRTGAVATSDLPGTRGSSGGASPAARDSGKTGTGQRRSSEDQSSRTPSTRDDSRSTKKKGTTANERLASSRYSAGQFDRAADKLREAARSASGAKAEELLAKAAAYEALGAAVRRAKDNADQDPVAAMAAYQEALAIDVHSGDGAHAGSLSEHLGKAASRAAIVHLQQGKYEKAMAACTVAAGNGRDNDPLVEKAQKELDVRAKSLYSLAVRLYKKKPSQAKNLWQRVLRMVPPENTWYQQSQAALRGKVEP